MKSYWEMDIAPFIRIMLDSYNTSRLNASRLNIASDRKHDKKHDRTHNRKRNRKHDRTHDKKRNRNTFKESKCDDTSYNMVQLSEMPLIPYLKDNPQSQK